MALHTMPAGAMNAFIIAHLLPTRVLHKSIIESGTFGGVHTSCHDTTSIDDMPIVNGRRRFVKTGCCPDLHSRAFVVL